MVVDLTAPSTRVRVINLIPLLQEKGIAAEIVLLPSTRRERIRLFKSMATADVVLLQKKFLKPLELFFLRHYARCLVFDYDDAIFLRDRGTCERDSFSLIRRLRFILTAFCADLQIAGNTYLAERARRFSPSGRRIEILPSAVPVAGVPTRDWSIVNPVPVVGWVGTSGGFRFLRAIAPALVAASRQQPFLFQVVCDRDFEWPGLTIQNLRWSKEEQEKMISGFDVGIMPLNDSPWTRGKCSYKVLQYMAAGIPFVASSVGMNIELADNSQTGLVATTHEEFQAALLALLRDPGRSASMGQCGRRLAETRYSQEIIATRLAQLLCETANGSVRK
jgi:glycosyltransferase involved in cell wall biosynthesis